MGMNAYLARGISICVSIGFTFVLNRTLTFSAAGPITFGEVSAYVSASFFGVAINYGVYAGLLRAGLNWLPAMVVGTVIASTFNFFAYQRIFRARG